MEYLHTFSDLDSRGELSSTAVDFSIKPYRQAFLIYILTTYSSYSLADIADYLQCDLCLLDEISRGKGFLCQSHTNKLVGLFCLFCAG